MFRTGKAKSSKKPRSRSERAGVVFPVGRLGRYLRKRTPHCRFGAAAPVYVAAILEYLSAEVLELAGNHARDNRKKTIKPKDIRVAISLDTELSQLCKDVTFSEGGSIVNILGALIPGHPDSIVKKKTAKPNYTKTSLKTVKLVTTRNKSPKKTKTKLVVVDRAKPAVSQSTAGSSSAASGSAAAASIKLPVLSEGSLFLGQKLTVLMGDVSAVKADAIVHPTNSSYSTSGQVGQVLLARGGSEYQTALNSLKAQGSLANCGASVCDMFNIAVSKIIHCNSPSWNKSGGVVDLHKTIENCLKLADNENMKSIALPSVGSGNAGWPKQLAAETILRSINRYFQTVMASSIRQVYFVLYDKESVDIYTTELRKLLENSD